MLVFFTNKFTLVVFQTWSLTTDHWHLEPGTWNLEPGTWNLVHYFIITIHVARSFEQNIPH